ncbi:MAG: hypothetical protein K1X83_09030 [Oligoflexia bacterium]|nr:hypothetical protein [Oligoflexia bacterium]
MRSKTIQRSVMGLLALAFLAGCGDGNSNDGRSDEKLMSGIWVGSVAKESDTCGTNLPGSFTFTHTVNQNGEAIVLTDQNGVQYLGNLVGTDGFSVDVAGSGTFLNQPCPATQRFEYSDVDDDDDRTGTVNFRVIPQCPNQVDCVVSFLGAASR